MGSTHAATKDGWKFVNSPHDQWCSAPLTPVNPCRNRPCPQQSFLRREVNTVRTRTWNTTHSQRTQERSNLSSRVGEDDTLPIKWPACPTRYNQSRSRVSNFTFEPICLQWLRAQETKSSGKSTKKHAIHLHAFQDGVFAAALDADANPPVILFMPLWRTTLEKTVEKSNNFRSTARLSCKTCLSMVWFATSLLWMLQLKSSPTAFKRCTVSSVISFWRILHTISAVRSEDIVERFRTSVDMKRNRVANNWAKHYVGIDVVRAKLAFYLTVSVCDRSTRTDGRDG